MSMEVSRSHMVSTSAIRGTLVRTYSPSASTVAAISLRAEFLAPETRMAPSSGGPAHTKKQSLVPPPPVLRGQDGPPSRRADWLREPFAGRGRFVMVLFTV